MALGVKVALPLCLPDMGTLAPANRDEILSILRTTFHNFQNTSIYIDLGILAAPWPFVSLPSASLEEHVRSLSVD